MLYIPNKVKFIALFGSTRFYTDDDSDMGIYSYCLPLGELLLDNHWSALDNSQQS